MSGPKSQTDFFQQCQKHKVFHSLLFSPFSLTANFTITEIGVIASADGRKKYNQKRAQIDADRQMDCAEAWGFHGTSRGISPSQHI